MINDLLREKRKLEYKMKQLKKMDRASIVLEEIDNTMEKQKVLKESKKEEIVINDTKMRDAKKEEIGMGHSNGLLLLLQTHCSLIFHIYVCLPLPISILNNGIIKKFSETSFTN